MSAKRKRQLLEMCSVPELKDLAGEFGLLKSGPKDVIINQFTQKRSLTMVDILETYSRKELIDWAKALELTGISSLNREELISAIDTGEVNTNKESKASNPKAVIKTVKPEPIKEQIKTKTVKPVPQKVNKRDNMNEKAQLNQILWNIANDLRGKMGADEFRDYILGFIFFKYLSEKMHSYADEVLEPDGIGYLDINADTKEGAQYIEAIRFNSIETLGYFLKPSELFHVLAERANPEGKAEFILGDLQQVLTNIALSTMGSESEDDFESLFEDLDLTSSKLGKTENAKNELISKVLVSLDSIDFRLEDSKVDILGDAYEYLIGQFASGAGKKAGEFYTPQEVSTILAKIVTLDKPNLKSVYDPTCGSGSLLLRVSKEAKKVSDFYGQESNPTTYNLCRMNMIMHNVHYRNFDIKNEDTLEKPQHVDEKFDAIVANPPFSANWSANPLFMSDDRFSAYGKLAPSSKADFAFVQHMIHHLDNDGTMAVVLPHGVLFRGAAEGHIRKHLIAEKNELDAVIGLPANIFYGTSIPTCILVIKKNRKNKDNILFVDASQNFEKVKTQNMLRASDIAEIIDTLADRKSKDKFSYVAPMSEIEENEFNLNIPRYVDTFEEDESIDISAVAKEIRAIDKEMVETDKVIAGFCKELGIDSPF